jgi:hypothetical protein
MSNFSNEMPQISLDYFVNLLTTLKSQIDGVSEIDDLWTKFIPQVQEKYQGSIQLQDSVSIGDLFINLVLNDLAISIIENKIIKDAIITPWDINNGIRISEVLSSIFPNSTGQTFQVEIRNNNAIYNADIEEEFAFGFLTFVLNFLPNELHNNILLIKIFMVNINIVVSSITTLTYLILFCL